MPIHIAPSIRAREEAAEAAGLQVPLNSASVTLALIQESSGKSQKVVPAVTYHFNGNQYQAK